MKLLALTSRTRRVSTIVLPIITFIVFLTIWYVYAKFHYDNPIQRRNALPYPHEIFTDGFLPLNDKVSGLRPILGYMWPTAKVTLLGLLISVTL